MRHRVAVTAAITGPPVDWLRIDETMKFHEQYEHEARTAVGGSEFMALLGHRTSFEDQYPDDMT